MTRTRIPYPSAQPVYAAAALWRDRCLLEDLGLFDDNRISTLGNAEVLVRDFVEQPDLGEGTFLGKLRGQLADASPGAVQMAAELLYVHLLIARSSTIGGAKKMQQVRTVLGFADGHHEVPGRLAHALESGLINPGQGYNNYRWRQYAYLIKTVAALKRLPEAERRRALTEPQAFIELLDGLVDNGAAIQRFSLEHLLFPDVFAPVVSRDHRQQIVKTWPVLAGGADEHPSFRIAAVANGLAPNGRWESEEFVNFYRAPLLWEWQEENSRWNSLIQWGERIRESVDLAVNEQQYKLEGAAALRAARESGLGTDLQVLRRSNLVDWRVVDSFLTWLDEAEDNQRILADLWTEAGPASIDRFLDQVPTTAVSGIGARLSLASALLGAVDVVAYPPWRATPVDLAYRLTGHTKPEPSATEGERYEVFLVFLDQVIDAFRRHGKPLADRLEAQSLLWTLMTYDPPVGWTEAEADAFRGWRRGSGALPVRSAPEAPADTTAGSSVPEAVEQSLSDLAGELYLDELFLERVIQLLNEKKQVIFQGSPGTGKTYIGRKLADWIAGSAERVHLVQFHPTYSYEDFVDGYRPRQEGSGFDLRKGPLLRIAEEAAAHPDLQFVLVIDELNRANVAQVFGELYFLLEYRKESVQLLYRQQPVQLPSNLLLIATMNTADRSIALLDSALRRRFYFVDFTPQTDPVAGVLRKYLREHQPGFEWLADAVAKANEKINDPDAAIGPSHFFRPTAIDDNWLELVWDHAVLPTLRDHFHGREGELAGLSLAQLRAEVTGSTDEDTQLP
ncbi:McrB family protein [Amycolatopsis sp. lyj-109]|uniref:McrB family protein n=1 Tax=Amycolatopsis sp. lyj-109 TaxID=2789287 RepID=UPI00397DFFDA